jgi:hypothetical protein
VLKNVERFEAVGDAAGEGDRDMDGSRSDVIFEFPNGSGGKWMALVSGDEESTTKSVVICIIAAIYAICYRHILTATVEGNNRAPCCMFAMLSRKKKVKVAIDKSGVDGLGRDLPLGEKLW